jgi:hypothetical protein
MAQKAANPSIDNETADDCLQQNTKCEHEHNRELFATAAMLG